jgi:hypothetical protein
MSEFLQSLFISDNVQKFDRLCIRRFSTSVQAMTVLIRVNIFKFRNLLISPAGFQLKLDME